MRYLHIAQTPHDDWAASDNCMNFTISQTLVSRSQLLQRKVLKFFLYDSHDLLGLNEHNKTLTLCCTRAVCF